MLKKIKIWWKRPCHNCKTETRHTDHIIIEVGSCWAEFFSGAAELRSVS